MAVPSLIVLESVPSQSDSSIILRWRGSLNQISRRELDYLVPSEYKATLASIGYLTHVCITVRHLPQNQSSPIGMLLYEIPIRCWWVVGFMTTSILLTILVYIETVCFKH